MESSFNIEKVSFKINRMLVPARHGLGALWAAPGKTEKEYG
jgi:hypothetical protein